MIDVPTRRKSTAQHAPVTQQLRDAIERCGLSRYELCKRAGVEQSALSRFMSGQRGLTTHALDRLGSVLDLEIVMHGPKQTAATSSAAKRKTKGE